MISFGPMTLHAKNKNTLDCEVNVFINFLDKGKEKKVTLKLDLKYHYN